MIRVFNIFNIFKIFSCFVSLLAFVFFVFIGIGNWGTVLGGVFLFAAGLFFWCSTSLAKSLDQEYKQRERKNTEKEEYTTFFKFKY